MQVVKKLSFSISQSYFSRYHGCIKVIIFVFWGCSISQMNITFSVTYGLKIAKANRQEIYINKKRNGMIIPIERPIGKVHDSENFFLKQ